MRPLSVELLKVLFSLREEFDEFREPSLEPVLKIVIGKMSEYENVVGGKLRLKGKALDVKGGGIRKKKKPKKQFDSFSQPVRENDPSTGRNSASLVDFSKENINDIDSNGNSDNGQYAAYDDQLTPAERRYLQQWEKIDLQRMAKRASKSHRDRIHEFNRYLANLSEHHDIPKVGPG